MQKVKSIATKLINYARKQDIYLVLRFQHARSRLMNVKNGKVDKSEFAEISGVGIHAFTKSGHTGFASIDSVENFNAIKRTVDSAIRAAKTAQNHKFESSKEIFKLKPTKAKVEKVSSKDPFEVGNKKQEKDLLRFHKILQNRYKDFSISNSVRFRYDNRRIFRSDGTDVEMTRCDSLLVTLLSYSEGEFSNELYHTTSGIGYEVLASKEKIKEHLDILENKARYVVSTKDVQTLTPGKYFVLLDSEISGTLVHEAFGHSAETDHVYQKSPLLKNKKVRRGEKIAPSYINIYDYSQKSDNGYTPYSDFGVKRKKAIIVKNGRINDLLSDIYTARKTGTRLIGASRAEFYNNVPIPRMSTTSIEVSGKYNKKIPFDYRKESVKKLHEHLVKLRLFDKCEKVIFLKGFSGGQTNSYTGDFQFGTQFSFVFTKDKITQVKPLSFSGITNEVLASIESSFGESLPSEGNCGKAGQYVPVSDKSPILLLKPNKYLNVG
jgi:TldD protein